MLQKVRKQGIRFWHEHPYSPFKFFIILIFIIKDLCSGSDKPESDDAEDVAETNPDDKIAEPQMKADTGEADCIDGSKETHQGNVY